jgi:bifunctional non-homologous end joining protein LigD
MRSHQQTRLRPHGDMAVGARLKTLAPVLGALACKEPRAEGPWEREERTYVEPALVVKVRYFGWSSDGHLRGPVFLGIREDVNPRDCRVEPLPP